MLDLSPYLAPAIALLAAVIAWAQWHTARSKLVLDLFNQRLEVYNNVSAVMGRVMREGTATTEDTIDVARQGDKARFLFGDDVRDYLKALQKVFAQLGYCRSVIAQHKGDDDYQKAVEHEFRVKAEIIIPFYDDFGKLLEPYMGMHQKKPLWRMGLVTSAVNRRRGRSRPRKK
jgi:hypothetical protein